jgi:hypothetical protein
MIGSPRLHWPFLMARRPLPGTPRQTRIRNQPPQSIQRTIFRNTSSGGKRKTKLSISQRITVNGWEAARGLVHFDFTVNRQADDLNNGIGVEVVGKGALHCQTQSFAAISIGDARAQ